MSLRRILGAAVSVAVVGACALAVVGLSRANDPSASGSGSAGAFVMPTLASSTYVAPTRASTTAVPHTSAARVTPAATHPRTAAAANPATTSHAAATHPVVRPTTSAPARVAHTSTPPPPSKPHVVHGVALPLPYTTGSATRVITVVASSHASTVATLQAWTKAPGGGWLRWGGAITAHVGAQGLISSPSESLSATPIGSFTLTQAFGRLGNPGTGLPYFSTTSADWWISQSGPLYNTHQHCAGSCPFAQGSPNEHLAYELPYYNYAVVIDANTRNAPGGVHQGGGSAFFLHVTDGAPTAGCVAIPQGNLVPIMQWLTPAAQPRILIGVA